MTLFGDYKWRYDPIVFQWCESLVVQIIGKRTKGWKRKGSWMEYWKGDKRIALAPHKSGLALYFMSRDGTPAIYKEMGGICPVGKCVIRIPYNAVYDLDLLKFIVGKYV